MLKCLVFDCDGVILDSVAVKSVAFGRLAEPYGPEARLALEKYHDQHGGVSRFLKFEWFFREILKREITPAESAEWGRKFTEYALDEVRRCPMIPGAMDVLETWCDKIPMYVCSGTPSGELAAVLRERRLDHFFRGIYGTPPIKEELLKTIVESDAKVEANMALMVGDSSTDLDAAKYAGTQFYAVGAGLKGGDYPWSMDLTGLKEWLATKNEKV